jgi:hypothetical protein
MKKGKISFPINLLGKIPIVIHVYESTWNQPTNLVFFITISSGHVQYTRLDLMFVRTMNVTFSRNKQN